MALDALDDAVHVWMVVQWDLLTFADDENADRDYRILYYLQIKRYTKFAV